MTSGWRGLLRGVVAPAGDGPWFEDFTVGEQLDPAPAITIGPGEAAVYQAICGDPLAISLSQPLAEAMTGQPGSVVNPALVLQVAIGQSTVATRKVVANLFYRGVRLLRTVRVGDTLTTAVTVRGLREASARPDRPPGAWCCSACELTMTKDDWCWTSSGAPWFADAPMPPPATVTISAEPRMSLILARSWRPPPMIGT